MNESIEGKKKRGWHTTKCPNRIGQATLDKRAMPTATADRAETGHSALRTGSKRGVAGGMGGGMHWLDGGHREQNRDIVSGREGREGGQGGKGDGEVPRC